MSTLQYLVRYVVIIALYAYVWKIVRIVGLDIQHAERKTTQNRRLVAIDPEVSETGEIEEYKFDTSLSLSRDSNGRITVTSGVLGEKRDVVVFCRTNRCYIYVTKGDVFLNGERVKRLKAIRSGDIIEYDGAIFEYRE